VCLFSTDVNIQAPDFEEEKTPKTSNLAARWNYSIQGSQQEGLENQDLRAFFCPVSD